MRVIYHPDAETELIEAATFYARRVPGLGESLLAAFNTTLAQIESQPNWASPVEGDIRRRSLRRFPYAIYYRVVGDDLRILAVKHHSQRPDYWRYRITE